MRKSIRNVIIVLLLLASMLFAGCSKKEAPVEYDKQLYCDAITKVFKEHGYNNIELDEEFSDEKSYLLTAVSDNLEKDIRVWLYWGGNIYIEYIIYKSAPEYAEYDTQLIADLLNSVGEYTFTSEFIDERIEKIRIECYRLGKSSYTMDYLNPDTKNIFDDGGQMSYYTSNKIGSGNKWWDKGYRYTEQFDIGCGLRVLEN